MNLRNFEQEIDKTILKRGLDYYENGWVCSLENVNGTWTAEVSGSNDYDVTAKLSEDGDILQSDCNCPYECGEYCKHQAAVFYALKELPKREIKQKSKNKKAQKADLSSLLSAQSAETLAAILIEYAENDKQIKNDLMLRFSVTDNITKLARDLIRSSIKKAMSRGYVEYGYAGQAIEGAEKVLSMAEGLIHTGSPIVCIKLLIIVLEEMIKLIQYCDDSNGEIGGVIESAINNLNTVTSEISENFDKKTLAFELIINHAASGLYDGWSSLRLDIAAACIPFCADSVLRGRLESMLENYQGDRYCKHQTQLIKSQIIAAFDGEDAADAFRAKNLDNDEFRRILIEKAVSHAELEYALKLCIDGESADQAYPGLVKRWKEMRYSVHGHMSDIPAQIELARSLVLDGDFNYYTKLKSLFHISEWPDILDKLLMDVNRRNNDVYVKILIAEDLKHLLLEYLRQNSRMLPDLYKYLLPDYQHDLPPLFNEVIKRKANEASYRKDYQAVCGIIQKYRHACGKSPALVIIDELLEIHKKRPAFVDELKKCYSDSI